MSDSKAENNAATPSQKPVPKIKDISMMKAWKDSKVSIYRKLDFSFRKIFLPVRHIENIHYLFNHSIELYMV